MICAWPNHFVKWVQDQFIASVMITHYTSVYIGIAKVFPQVSIMREKKNKIYIVLTIFWVNFRLYLSHSKYISKPIILVKDKIQVNLTLLDLCLVWVEVSNYIFESLNILIDMATFV